MTDPVTPPAKPGLPPAAPPASPGAPPGTQDAAPGSPPVPPRKIREARFTDALILLAVFLACQAVLGVVISLVVGATRANIGAFAIACVEAGSLAALIPVIRARLGHRLIDFIRYAPVRAGSWVAILVCCAGLILGLRQLEGLVLQLIPMTSFWRAIFGELVGASAFAGSLVMAALAAPMVEEVIFRAIILRGFALHYGKAPALLYSSLLFGVVHLNPWQFFPAVVLGLFLGALYLRTGTVVISWAAHALYNGAILVLSRFSSTRALVDAETSGGISAIGFTMLTAAGVAVFCVGFWLFLRSSRPAAARPPGPPEGQAWPV